MLMLLTLEMSLKQKQSSRLAITMKEGDKYMSTFFLKDTIFLKTSSHLFMRYCTFYMK